MQTQLAAQLKSIRVQNADVVDFSSILFSPKDASKLNIQSIYSLGRNGIMELIRIDDRFQRFDETLFGSRLLSSNRDNLTEVENKEIDAMVKDYLFSVAPYMLLKCVQKTLEYLIRRFSIHTYNAEDFFLAILPYHENPLFPRVFKILRLESSLFNFLANVKKTETPVVRSSLSQQCKKDPAFLEFILNGIRRLNEVGTIPVSHLTLVCAIVVDLAIIGSMDEYTVRQLIGFASLGFASPNTEFQATSLLILAQIAINVKLNDEVITACLNNILRIDQCNMRQLLECLVLLFRNNTSYVMPEQTAAKFLTNDSLPLSLQTLAVKTSVLPLFVAVAPALCSLALKDSAYLDTVDFFVPLLRGESELKSFVQMIMTSLNTTISTRTLTTDQTDHVQKVLLKVSGQCGEIFDGYLSELANDTPLKSIAQKLFTGSSHMVLSSGRTLFTSLDNREYAVRKEVCELLVSQVISCSDSTPSSERVFLKNSVVSLLEDDYLDLSLRLLQIPKSNLLTVFSSEELALLLFSLLAHKVLATGSEAMAEEVVGAVFALLRSLDLSSFVQSVTTATHTSDSNMKMPSMNALVCSLYSYLLRSETAGYKKDCLVVLCSLPHPFTRIPAKTAAKTSTQDLPTVVATALLKEAKQNEAASNQIIVSSLKKALADHTSAIVPFFVKVALAMLKSLPESEFRNQIACCISSCAMEYIEQIPAEVSLKQRDLSKDLQKDLPTLSLSSLLEEQTPSLESVGGMIKFMLSVLTVCATELSWPTQDLLDQYSRLRKISAHPLSVLCYCFSHFTVQQSFYMVVANAIVTAVWGEEPSTPYTTLLFCSTEEKTILQALNKVLTSVSTSILSHQAFFTTVMASLIHLQNPLRAIRSTVLSLFETLRAKVSTADKAALKRSRKNSRDSKDGLPMVGTGLAGVPSGTEEERMTVLLQLLSYLLSFGNEIRDDAKLFTIKFNLLFTSDKPALSRDAIASVLLPLIMQLEPVSIRNRYLTLCLQMPYTESSEEVVLERCLKEYEVMKQTAAMNYDKKTAPNTQMEVEDEDDDDDEKRMEEEEEEDDDDDEEENSTPSTTKRVLLSTELVTEWELLVPWFFRAMAHTLTRQQAFRSALFAFMETELVVPTANGPYAPLSVVLKCIHNDVFVTMNEPEKLSLLHALLAVASRTYVVDAVQVYHSVNSLELSISLLLEEAKMLVKDDSSSSTTTATSASQQEQQREQIRMMTAFLEVITRNEQFNTNLQTVDPLLILLGRLVTLVKAYAPARDTAIEESERATAGSMEIEEVHAVEQKTAVLSDTLALFYPIQILLESLHTILSSESSPVKVVTSQQTLQNAEPQQPSSKRARRNSITIKTDLLIDPQLLVDLIDLNLTTQINKTCLQLLAVLASMHSQSVDKHLFACFENLAQRVILRQDEEAFNVIISVLTHCLRQFNKEKQILLVYQTFLSCVPYIPYSQSIQLLNTLIAHSSINYIGHIIAYLLLLNNSIPITVAGATSSIPVPSQRVQKSEAAASGIYHFVTSVFMGVNLLPQIQALGVLAAFAEYLTSEANQNGGNLGKSGNGSHISLLTRGLLQSVPLAQWNEEAMTAVTINNIIVTFIKDIISHPTFIGKVATTPEKEQDRVQKHFVHIIESLLLLLQNCSLHKDEIGASARGRARTEEEQTLIHAYHDVELAVYDCVTVFSEVLSVTSLLTILAVLLKHEDGAIRKRSLLMLNKKINDSTEALSKADITAYLQFVQNLVELCGNAAEATVTKQTALLSIHILAQFFAESHPAEFIPAVQMVVGIVSQTNNTTPDMQVLKGSAYVALSMLCSRLGIRMLPYLPKFAPSLLKEMESALQKLQSLREEIDVLADELREAEEAEEAEEANNDDDDDDDDDDDNDTHSTGNSNKEVVSKHANRAVLSEAVLKAKRALEERQSQREEVYVLLQSLVSSLNAVVMNQSGLLSVYLHRMLTLSFSPEFFTTEKHVLTGAVNVLHELMTEKIDTRLLLPAIIDTLKTLPPHAASSISHLFETVRLLFDQMADEKVAQYYTKAWSFCVQGLETRGKWEAEGVPEEDIVMVEKAVVSAMVAITLKLSEAQLTPLFIQTVSWMEEKSVVAESLTNASAESQLPPVAKAIPFFTLVTELASTFKSIFTPFFGQFFETSVAFIDAFGRSCKKEKRSEQSQREQEGLYRLVRQVVLALYKCFLYDSDGWLDEAKFKTVATPLVRLIGAYFIPAYTTEYPKFMTNYVVPTTVQLVVSTSGHDDWWQEFNHQVLVQTRSPINAVKLVAIRVVRECFERLSQEYLPLLPDVIPFLADLLEAEDAEVEKMAQELRRQLESLSGEELTSYLTM